PAWSEWETVTFLCYPDYGSREGTAQIFDAVSWLKVTSRSATRTRNVLPTASVSCTVTSRPGVRARWLRYASRRGASRSATSDTRVIVAPWPAASAESLVSRGDASE